MLNRLSSLSLTLGVTSTTVLSNAAAASRSPFSRPSSSPIAARRAAASFSPDIEPDRSMESPTFSGRRGACASSIAGAVKLISTAIGRLAAKDDCSQAMESAVVLLSRSAISRLLH
jgi:hypothetical protein